MSQASNASVMTATGDDLLKALAAQYAVSLEKSRVRKAEEDRRAAEANAIAQAKVVIAKAIAEAKKMAFRNRAPSILQSHWRGKLGRERAALVKVAAVQRKSAVRIQSVARVLMAKRLFAEMLVLREQERIRVAEAKAAEEARAAYARSVAFLTIERYWRGHKARKTFALKKRMRRLRVPDDMECVSMSRSIVAAPDLCLPPTNRVRASPHAFIPCNVPQYGDSAWPGSSCPHRPARPSTSSQASVESRKQGNAGGAAATSRLHGFSACCALRGQDPHAPGREASH